MLNAFYHIFINIINIIINFNIIYFLLLYNYNFFLFGTLIALDGIFVTIEYIFELFKKNNYKIDLFQYYIKSITYDNNIIDRYIIFLLLDLFYLLSFILFWNIIDLYNYIIIIAYPPITNYILKIQIIDNIISKIYLFINKYFKKALIKIITYLINKFINNNFTYNVIILDYDIKELFFKKDISQIMEYVKLFMINILIYYLDNINFSYIRLINFLHKYNMISEQPELPKKYINMEINIIIKQIIENKEYDLLFNRKIIREVFNIYKNNKNNSLKESINNFFNLSFEYLYKFLCFLTVANYINTPYISIIISLLISCNKNNLWDIKKYIVKFTSIIFYLKYHNIFYTLLISEFLELLDNRLTRYLLKSFVNLLFQKRYIFFYNYQNFIELTILTIFLHYNNLSYFNILLILFLKNKLILAYLVFFGIFSNYNLSHLSLLSLILFIGVNIYHHKEAPKTFINPISNKILNLKHFEINKEICFDISKTPNKLEVLSEIKENKIIDNYVINNIKRAKVKKNNLNQSLDKIIDITKINLESGIIKKKST
jgi:hypothetical protein